MKRFILKIIYVALPVFLIILCSAIINPYSHPALNSISISRDLLHSVPFQCDQRLQKAIFAINHQCPIVFVGDSRTNQLFPDSDSDTPRNISNLAIGGASCNEITSLAWHALHYNKNLSALYVGLSFNHFSMSSQSNLLEGALTSSMSAMDILANKHNTKSTLSFLMAALADNKTSTSRSDVIMHNTFENADAFWEYQLESSARIFYENMEPNFDLFPALDSLYGYCLSRNVELILFSPPTHIDLQNQVDRWGKSDLRVKFHEGLNAIGCRYVNLDKPDTLTLNKSNFSDPFHLSKHKKFIRDSLINHMSPLQ